MKKTKLIISAICVSLSIIICAVMVHLSNKNFVEDVFIGTDIQDGVDEYLISQGYLKFPEKEKAVWLTENTDTDFEKDSKSLAKTVKALKNSLFDTVFIRSEYFSSVNEELSLSENLSKISNLVSLLKEQEKKAYLEMHTDFDEKVFAEAVSVFDGIILRNDKKMSPEKFNMLLSKAVRYIRKYDKDIKILVYLPFDSDISKLNKKIVDGVCTFIDEKSDLTALSLWDKTLTLTDGRLYCTVDVNVKKKSAAFPLTATYGLRGCESLSAVAYSSLKAVTEDVGGAFSAVSEYLTKGIVPDIAFRSLSITGYDGSVLQTNLFSTEIEICGSSLYPCYINGKETELGEKGSKKITFYLSEGENEFTVSQCGQTVKYRIEMSFDGEIIRTVMPGESLTVQPGEKITVTVIAYSGADITVKLGTKEYEAKCEEGVTAGYAAFTAKIKMPETREQVESLGMISVIGSVGERTVQQKGAMIYCGEEMTTVPTLPAEQEENTTAVQLGNYVQELIGDKYEYTVPSATKPYTPPTTVHYNPVYETVTGNVMCVVTEPYADTRPLVYNDDTYVPSYSALVQGTMDYVTAKSSAFNSDENETVYFYELASGRKVKCDHVQLVNAAMSNNSLSVVSCSAENGTLVIKLKTDWRVPYAISHTPQNYYSGHGTKYNISSFNANYIQIDFYHTATVTGNVDVKGSNTVSSATWSVSQNENRTTLYMPLSSGKYYGTSVEYDSEGYMIIKVHNRPQSLQGAVILLDPGHGGEDPGALGIGDQVRESDINIAVAYAVRDALRAKGATVYLTRPGNETLSLDERRNMAQSLEPDLFVSVHSNASENKNAIGTAVYYYKGFSQPLANNIYGEMIKVFKNNLYYGQQELYDDLSDGAMYYPFAVTRLEDCPSVLIETGYVTNDAECYKLIESSTHQLFGQAIANGIEKTLAG
ncbi:MAG: N-acetylmuramoyl-L-alanine amidase [Ruminococcaceae bacterium]|nr:N-acetylmuramoyl-L-alanine amidase [Oscillospiraceae bacterium]